MVLVRTIHVFIKLIPVILALKKDRILWISKEGKNIDEKRFRRNAQRILNTCISLGPVFIKFGQWLSSRSDILPQPHLEELSKLQDSVPAVPLEKVRQIIEKELGGGIESRNLYISHADGEKHYESKERTIYRSKDNKISAEMGMDLDMNKNLMK